MTKIRMRKKEDPEKRRVRYEKAKKAKAVEAKKRKSAAVSAWAVRRAKYGQNGIAAQE